MSEINTLVVFRIADNRIIHSREQRYGLPLIGDLSTAIFDSSSAIFDSSTMDYLVGVNSYDPEDFDDDGVLTDEAVTKYGVDAGEVAKYIKDMEIVVPDAARCDDFTFDDETGVLTEAIQAAAERARSLKLSVGDLTNITLLGTDLFGTPVYALPAKIYPDGSASKIEFEIQKLDSNGDPMTDPSNLNWVHLYASRGVIDGVLVTEDGLRKVQLEQGAAAFDVWIPQESCEITIQVHAEDHDGAGKDVISGSYRILIGSVIPE